MYYIVSSEEMKYLEKNTIEGVGVSSIVLMEKAAIAVWEYLQSEQCDVNKTLIVCGTGNNGGDGLALARILFENDFSPTVVLIGDRNRCTASTKIQMDIVTAYGIHIYDKIPPDDFTTIIDALFGIGINRDLSEKYYDAVKIINSMSGRKVAIDVPSGINADSGKVMGIAFKADITVTFAYRKRGTTLYPGAEYAGKILVGNIGIKSTNADKKPSDLIALEAYDVQLPLRKPDSHKGNYGKVLVIAGSNNMCGAALLSAKAVFRSGAGMVKVLTEETNRIIMQRQLPEAMLETYTSEKIDFLALKKALQWSDVIVLGPGISMSEQAVNIVKFVLEESTCPMILDADALNIIAQEKLEYSSRQVDTIITPHLGEMARLTGEEISVIKDNMIETAHAYAWNHHITCVLKDTRTIVSAEEEPDCVNMAGNAGMATAGAGDVLAGIIAGIKAQNTSSYQAAITGVYLHSAAGDVAAKKCGIHAMMATDILDGLIESMLTLYCKRGEKNE